jgi:hypothetical protein
MTKKKERLPVEIEESTEDDTGQTYPQDMPTTEEVRQNRREEGEEQGEDNQEERAEKLAKSDLEDVENPNHSYVRFLKAYAKSPDVEHTKVASRLGISQREANIYIKRFSHALYKLINDDNPLETMTAALNNPVKDTDIEISEEEV